jgi:hypothetical protein
MLIEVFDPVKAYLVLCSHTGTGFDDPRVGKTTLDVSTGQVVGVLHEQGWGYVGQRREGEWR